MIRTIFAFLSSLLLMQQALAERPNIVLMMADDMGVSDIGCYGGEIETPALNQLAKDGVRFSQFYNTSRCCPTRASLLTGLYPHQAGVGHMMEDRGLIGYKGNLNEQCRTIAEVLKPAGYSTYMSGKWHITRHRMPEGPKFNWPKQRGFDRFYGTIHGAGSFFDPNSLTRGNEQIVPDDEPFYYTDAIGNNASKFIKEHQGNDPFFLYVAFTAPHWPMHALPKDIEKYKGRYDKGWDVLREERLKRMIDIGLIKPEWQMTERDPEAPSWQAERMKTWMTRRMEVYAAMVDSMDQNVAKVVAALKERGVFDNTLILFLADNGGCAEEFGSSGKVKPALTAAQPLIPMKPGELQLNMVPKTTRDGKPLRSGRGVMPGAADTYVAYGLPWANASNTPFRRYKHWVHEGGISTPLIAHWPKGLQQNRRNSLVHEPGHLIDIMATCVDVSKADYPEEVDGKPIHPMQGESLVPLFKGDGNWQREEPLFWEHEGNRAVRDGKWKLVATWAKGTWELFDLEKDRTETNDLAAAHPARVQAMAALWKNWAVQANVLPWIWDKKR
ncbi:MAG: arylsulfatase A-like enzyme [Verrucomicrobiales bacterium]|jgi:arylsulfatase A-like enzyme